MIIMEKTIFIFIKFQQKCWSLRVTELNRHASWHDIDTAREGDRFRILDSFRLEVEL